MYGTTPGKVVLSCLKRKLSQGMGGELKSGTPPWPLCQLLLTCVPALTSLDGEPKPERRDQPFLLHVAFIHVVLS